MAENRAITVLLASDDPATRGRWLEMLAGLAAVIDGAPPEVVITDRADVTPMLGLDVRDSVARGETTVLSIGAEGGDASLPEDAAPREVRLACSLLARIARLKREAHAADAQRHALVEEAARDPLTGLANRRAWDLRLARALDAGGPLLVALLDLDHFKPVNDALGHAAGDEVLRQTARALEPSVRQGDFAARLGGDEFGLLLPAVEPHDAAAVCERIRRHVAEHLHEHAQQPLTASVGYLVTSGGTSAETVFQQISAALVRAKQSGRNRSEAAGTCS